MKCAQCDHTERSPGGLINMDAYLGGAGEVRGWVCVEHIPDDWMGKPAHRLHAHELFAVHAYVEKNKEALSKQVKAPKPQTPD